jgi:predicted transcriptional regulator
MYALHPKVFGELETAILRIFWSSEGPLTVKEVHQMLRERDLAYTTVMTTMARLAENGRLNRTVLRAGKEGGRALVYSYTVGVSRGALLAAALEEACARLGAGQGDRAEALAVLLGAAR